MTEVRDRVRVNPRAHELQGRMKIDWLVGYRLQAAPSHGNSNSSLLLNNLIHKAISYLNKQVVSDKGIQSKPTVSPTLFNRSRCRIRIRNELHRELQDNKRIQEILPAIVYERDEGLHRRLQERDEATSTRRETKQTTASSHTTTP